MASRSQRKPKTKKSGGKRRRATAVAINKDGHVLLVRDKGKRSYSLPGGGINSNEPAISAATREVFEETGLVAHKAEWVCDYEGGTQSHVVYRLEVHGRKRLRSEISDATWWDRNKSLPLFDHVEAILVKMK
jgi:ADP-ribose pyrophosphatase YjhB (NUDIX family)